MKILEKPMDIERVVGRNRIVSVEPFHLVPFEIGQHPEGHRSHLRKRYEHERGNPARFAGEMQRRLPIVLRKEDDLPGLILLLTHGASDERLEIFQGWFHGIHYTRKQREKNRRKRSESVSRKKPLVNRVLYYS